MHEHLAATGFLDFVNSSPPGHLFVTPRGGDVMAAVDSTYESVRRLARSAVPDRMVQPNHAWRYTLKTRGLEAGISEHILDAICGHAPRTEGGGYTKVTLKTLVEAMSGFPRYSLTG